MRVRTDAKRRAILDVARAAFLRHGFAATSMAAIAAEVGGSKGTLYGYFPSKAALFSAVLHSESEEHMGPAMATLGGDGSPREVLTVVARALIAFLLLPQVVASWRLAVAEAGRFPELGRAFYEHGPRRGEDNMAAWMAAQIAAGRLRPAPPRWLAQQLLRLCQVGPYLEALCGIERAVTPEELDALAAFAVDTFLRAHETPAGQPAPG